MTTTFAFRMYRHNFWGIDQLLGDTLGATSADKPPDDGNCVSYARHPDLRIDDAFVYAMVEELDRADITGLSLADCQRITGSGIVAVAGLRRLRFLDLFNTTLTDRDLAVLVECRELEVLNLAGTAVDGSVLNVLAHLPKLHTLHLGFTELRPQYLAPLPFYPALRTLDLIATPTCDADMELLAHTGTLTELGLQETCISDRAVGILRPLAPQLTRLHLSYNMITDKCLTDLYELRVLQNLQLRATHIDRSNTDNLLGALPGLGDGAERLVW